MPVQKVKRRNNKHFEQYAKWRIERSFLVAEFWEQQLMDRLLTLCFKFRDQENVMIPAEEMKDVADYVKFIIYYLDRGILIVT